MIVDVDKLFVGELKENSSDLPLLQLKFHSSQRRHRFQTGTNPLLLLRRHYLFLR